MQREGRDQIGVGREASVRIPVQGVAPGGATTTGPDATPPPQLSVKTRGGGGSAGGSFGGGSAGGVGGDFGRGGGFQRWGGLRATHYYHMHTSWGDVCLGVWGYGGMYAIIALSRHWGAPLARSPTHYLSKPGGGGGGWGVSHTRTGPGRPPWALPCAAPTSCVRGFQGHRTGHCPSANVQRHPNLRYEASERWVSDEDGSAAAGDRRAHGCGLHGTSPYTRFTQAPRPAQAHTRTPAHSPALLRRRRRRSAARRACTRRSGTRHPRILR